MNPTLLRILTLVGVIALLPMAMVPAEVTVSVTLSGDMDEIIGILHQLKRLGAGEGDAAEDPLRLRVHSVMTGEDLSPEVLYVAPPTEAPPADEGLEATPEVPPTPALALTNPLLEPNSVAQGDPLLVSVHVVDEASQVDTVTAKVAGTEMSVDLLDNGTNGDVTAGDGIWTATLQLEEDLRPKNYAVDIFIFDVNGQPIAETRDGEDPLPLWVSQRFEVTR